MRLSLIKKTYSPLDYLFLIVWVKFTLIDAVRIVVSHLPIINSLSNYIIPGVMIIMTLISLRYFVKHLKPLDITLYIICINIYLLSYILYPQNAAFLDETTLPFLLTTLPYYFIGRVINYEKTAKLLNVLSIISVFYITFLSFRNSLSGGEVESGLGMYFAYLILPFVVTIFCNAFTAKNMASIFMCCLSFFMLLSFGNRGSVLYLMLYIVFCFFYTLKSNKRLLILSIALGVLLLLYQYFDILILGLYNIMDDLGFSVRIFEKIIENEIADSSGRDTLARQLFIALNEKPIGLGLLGDRTIIGGYSHNIFLELLVSFGYLFGSIISVLLVIIIISAYRKSKNTNFHMFYVGTICFGFLPLLTSNTFLLYPNFWLFLGYTTSILLNQSRCVDKNLLR